MFEGILKSIHEFIEKILHVFTRTLRRFAAYSMGLFFLGAVFGFFIPAISQRTLVAPEILLGIPAILAIASYYFTSVAVLVFLLLLGIFLFFFL